MILHVSNRLQVWLLNISVQPAPGPTRLMILKKPWFCLTSLHNMEMTRICSFILPMCTISRKITTVVQNMHRKAWTWKREMLKPGPSFITSWLLHRLEKARMQKLVIHLKMPCTDLFWKHQKHREPILSASNIRAGFFRSYPSACTLPDGQRKRSPK